MTMERFEAGGLNPATDSWVAVVRDVSTLAAQICATEFVPAALRPRGDDDWSNAAARVAAVILHGREVGLPPMTALAQTHIIEGRPAVSAEGMRALIFAAGHSILVLESTAARCKVQGRRRGQIETVEVTWTIEDAQRAGLGRPSQSGKPSSWQKYPRQLLLARASTELARMMFPDVIHGLQSVEELADMAASGDLDTPEPVEAPTVVRRAVRPVTPEPAREDPAERPSTPVTSSAPAGAARSKPAVPRRGARPASVPEPDADSTVGEAVDRPAAEDPRPAAPDQPASEDPPAVEDPPAHAEQPDAPQLISLAQRSALMAHWTRLKVLDRDERLELTGRMIRRPVATSNEIRVSEALRLLDALSHVRDRAGLDALLAAPTLPEPEPAP